MRPLTALGIVAVAALLNQLIIVSIASAILGALASQIIFTVVRIGIAYFGGGLVALRAGGSLVWAALVGPVVIFVDHVLVKGGLFLTMDSISHEANDGYWWLAFQGVLISFAMFAPIASAISWLGGYFAVRSLRRKMPQS